MLTRVEQAVAGVAERAGRAASSAPPSSRSSPGTSGTNARGQHLDRIAQQRHVLPIRKLRADAHAGDVLRQRDAEDVDVVAVRAVVEPELAEFLQVRDRRRLGIDEAERAARQRRCRRAPCRPPPAPAATPGVTIACGKMSVALR